jgi:hypothetical protein
VKKEDLIAERNGVGEQAKAARAHYHAFLDTFYDKDSPVAQVLERVGVVDPEFYGKPFTRGESANVGADKLRGLDAEGKPTGLATSKHAAELRKIAEQALQLRKDAAELKGLPKGGSNDLYHSTDAAEEILFSGEILPGGGRTGRAFASTSRAPRVNSGPDFATFVIDPTRAPAMEPFEHPGMAHEQEMRSASPIAVDAVKEILINTDSKYATPQAIARIEEAARRRGIRVVKGTEAELRAHAGEKVAPKPKPVKAKLKEREVIPPPRFDPAETVRAKPELTAQDLIDARRDKAYTKAASMAQLNRWDFLSAGISKFVKGAASSFLSSDRFVDFVSKPTEADLKWVADLPEPQRSNLRAGIQQAMQQKTVRRVHPGIARVLGIAGIESGAVPKTAGEAKDRVRQLQGH